MERVGIRQRNHCWTKKCHTLMQGLDLSLVSITLLEISPYQLGKFLISLRASQDPPRCSPQGVC